MGGELGRGGVVRDAALDDGGASGVGLDPDRALGGIAEPAADGDVAFDADAAIGADGVSAGLRQGAGRLFWGDAHQGAVLVFAGIEDHASDDGEAGGFGGFEGDGGLGEVSHGLDDEGVGASFGEGLGLFGEGRGEGFRGDLVGEEEFACGSDRCEDKGAACGGLAGELDAAAVDFGDLTGGDMVAEADTIGSEGIGEDDLAAGVDVGLGDLGDGFGPGKIPQVRDIAGVEPSCLEFRAPCAVGDHGAVRDELFEGDGHKVARTGVDPGQNRGMHRAGAGWRVRRRGNGGPR